MRSLIDCRLIVFSGLGFLVLAAGCAIIALASDLLLPGGLYGSYYEVRFLVRWEDPEALSIILAPVCVSLAVGKFQDIFRLEIVNSKFLSKSEF